MESLPNKVRESLPYESRLLEVPGGWMAYLDEGPRQAPPIVCLHGNPTWSFYWRALIPALQGRYRLIVPDHLGCGRSDKPQTGFGYRLQDHIDNLRRLLDHLDLDPATFVLHDWGGAIGMGIATAEPARTQAFVVTNTAAFPSKRIPWSIASARIPGLGPLMVRGLNAFARAATLRATHRGLSAKVKEGLLCPYDSWANRIAILRFVEDIPMTEGHPSWPTLTRIEAGLDQLRERPMLILWGDADFCFGPPFRKEWQARFPEAETHAWADVGHYVMEDAPERVLQHLEPFLERVHTEAKGVMA